MKRTVEGTWIGTAIDDEVTLKFSVLADIHPMIETSHWNDFLCSNQN